jgi:hypothetical protein
MSRQSFAMTEDMYLVLVMSFAALCGAFVGRVFASEAENRRTAVLAAAYMGAGAGLVGAPPFAFLLTFVVHSWRSGLGIAPLIDAIEATGVGLLWGPVGGAAGGLLLGILVALLGKGARRR